MFVRGSMKKDLITIREETRISEIRDLMEKNRIRHLPVVDQSGDLTGIVTDRDIRDAMPSSLLSEEDYAASLEKIEGHTAADIMTENPLTFPPAYTIQDALLMIQEKRVGAFPVVSAQGRLEGILSVRDLLGAFINVMGIGEPGILLCILADEKTGELKRIVDAITEEGVSFGSVLVAKYWDENKRAVFPYLHTSNVTHIKKKLKDLGFSLIDPMEWSLDQLPSSSE